jgi:replicative DNA helicase
MAARLGQGKTWALVRSAVAALVAGKTVQFHALEQSKTQLGIRFTPFLARQFGDGKVMFKASDLQHGTVDIVGYRKFLQELEKKTSGKLILDDTPRKKLSPLMLAAKIERNTPDVVIVDYLGLMNNTPGDWSAVAALSADMKEMATTYDIPIIAANQLNRAAGIGRGNIGPEALSGADAIGQDADGVITLKSESKRTKSMYLAKYRHGEDGNRWMMHFEPNIGIFDEVSEDKAMDLRDADDAGVTVNT